MWAHFAGFTYGSCSTWPPGRNPTQKPESSLQPAPDGSEFVKNEENWQWFQLVSKWARNLEMVDPSLIIDRRRYKATLNAPTYGTPPTPWAEFRGPKVNLPTAEFLLSSVEYASGSSYGYGPDATRTPSIVEL